MACVAYAAQLYPLLCPCVLCLLAHAQVFFYHSNCKTPMIMGIAKVNVTVSIIAVFKPAQKAWIFSLTSGWSYLAIHCAFPLQYLCNDVYSLNEHSNCHNGSIWCCG